MQLTIEIKNELAFKLRDQAQLNGVDLGQYIAMLIQDKLPHSIQKTTSKQALTPEETHLFQKINYGFSESFWARFKELNTKRGENKLDEKERLELISLADEMEKAHVERIKALITLAHIRGTDLESLMAELGILYGKDIQKD
jgi:hypothetical protein